MPDDAPLAWKVLNLLTIPRVAAADPVRYYLASPTRERFAWNAEGTSRAECECAGTHTCGVYGLFDSTSLELNYYATSRTAVLVQMRPIGATVLGDKGWRAAAVEIVAAYVVTELDAERVRSTYKRFPVIVVDEWPWAQNLREYEAQLRAQVRAQERPKKNVAATPAPESPLWRNQYWRAACTALERRIVAGVFGQDFCPWSNAIPSSRQHGTKSLRRVLERLAHMGVVVARDCPSGDESTATYRVVGVDAPRAVAAQPGFCHCYGNSPSKKYFYMVKIAHEVFRDDFAALAREIDAAVRRLENKKK